MTSWKTRNRRGSVWVEALLTLPILVLSTALAIEVARRAYLEVAFHHFAFLSARASAFRSDKATAVRFLDTALGPTVVMSARSLGEGAQYRFRVHSRYPAFLSFPWRLGRKHHFEVVRECPFPLSSG